MRDSDFWRSLANDFQTAHKADDFTAYRSYLQGRCSSSPNWELPKGHPVISAEFDALAARGAGKLATALITNLTVVWLEALWVEATTGPVRQGIEILNRNEITGLMHLRGKIENVFDASFVLCRKFEAKALQTEYRQQRHAEMLQRVVDNLPDIDDSPETEQTDNPVEPKVLRDRYLASFPQEKILIRDICWAARQHYREWKRWLAGELKPSSTPDLAFRKVLTSGKLPSEFNKKPRPSGWE